MRTFELWETTEFGLFAFETCEAGPAELWLLAEEVDPPDEPE